MVVQKSDWLIQSGISPKIGKIAYELLHRSTSKYTIKLVITTRSQKFLGKIFVAMVTATKPQHNSFV